VGVLNANTLYVAHMAAEKRPKQSITEQGIIYLDESVPNAH